MKKGTHHSKETKQKIAKLIREINLKNGIRPPSNLGKHHSEETKKKISKAHKGMRYSEEVKQKLRKPKSEEHKRKLSEMMFKRHQVGDKNPNWKGGITPINTIIRGSLEYKLWRKSVFERDNYTCIWCGARSGKGKQVILHADHIKPFSQYPELRFAIDNGRTLCRECHKKTDTFAGRIFTK
jgi:predicted restriction endonuclease